MRPDVTVLMCEALLDDARAALAHDAPVGLNVELLARPCESTRAGTEKLLAAAERATPIGGGSVVVAGGGCLAAGRDEGPRRHSRLRILGGETCFEHLVDRDELDRLFAERAFLVTPGWLSRWPKKLLALGVTPEVAPQIFAESATHVVLLDTGTSPTAEEDLRAFSGHVRLPAERRSVGLDHLRAKILGAAWAAQSGELARVREQLAEARRRTAEANAIAELARRVGKTLDETEIVRALMEIARQLTAAELAVWLPLSHDVAGTPIADPASTVPEATLSLLLHAPTTPTVTKDGELLVRITSPDGALGVLLLADLAFPSSAARYLDLLGPLSAAVQPMLGNARNLHGLIRLCAWCRKIGEPDGRWRTIEEYVHDHTPASFTHGICPTCMEKMEEGATTDL